MMKKCCKPGRYPYHLKQRISGGVGHLSNREAYDLFQNHRSDSLVFYYYRIFRQIIIVQKLWNHFSAKKQVK